jgi:STE24 endopeptidase
VVTTMTWGAGPPTTARRRAVGLFGTCRTMIAAPAMIGSVLLMLVLFGWMGRWEAPAMLVWMAGSFVVMTRVGERIVLRVGCRLRRPNAGQAATLIPLWSQALRRCGIGLRDVDLYVRYSGESNAFAVGARGVVVTTGLLAASSAGRLTDEHLVAVLVHELGHHVTLTNRYGLVTLWLAAPWRLATRMVVGIASAFARRQPSRWVAVVFVAGIVIATVQAVQGQQWSVAVVLTGITVAAVLCPIFDAALSRRCEFAADRYATVVGVGRELASALQILGNSYLHRRSLVARLLTRHPTTLQRIAALSPASLAQLQSSAHVRE